MKRISQYDPRRVKVESVMEWPKCAFCGFCHPANISKCPRIKSFDANFDGGRNYSGKS